MIKFVFDKRLSCSEQRQYLPPDAKFTKELSTVDKDLQKWFVIAWSTEPLPDDCEELFIEMLYMKILPH